MPKVSFRAGDAVSETLLVPLYCRAKEAQRPDALLRDERGCSPGAADRL